MRPQLEIGLTIGLLLLATRAGAQISLKDTARRNGGTAVTISSPMVPVTTLPELVRQADIIVYAEVGPVVSKLSSDETRVFTDYELVPMKVFKGRVQDIAKPLGPTRIMMRRPGGRMLVDGLTLISDNSGFPNDQMPSEGEECILFLQYDRDIEEYRPAGGAFGMFRVRSGVVNAVTKEVAERRQDTEMDYTSFATQLETLVAGLIK